MAPVEPGRRWPVAILLVLTPLLVGTASLISGQSANWDLLNYHLYNPHAWLNDRWSVDFFPAQLQGFYNPLLHLPYYLGFQHLDHRLLAFAVGGFQGLLIFPLYVLARSVLAERITRRGCYYIALLGLLGPIFLSELGTVFGDSILAIFMVIALALVIQRPDRNGAMLLAGCLAGVASGLKLTMVMYLPGLALALLLAAPAARLRPFAVFCTAVLFGYCLSAAWWIFDMADRFGNPLFPYFNEWFQSPWAPPESFRDARFLPDSILSGLFRPILAAIDNYTVLELKFRGPRVLMLFLSLLVLPLVWRRTPLCRRSAGLLAFFAVGILMWSFLVGYYRYLAGLEAMAPIGLATLWYAWGRGSPRVVNVVPILLFLSQLAVKVPSWGRVEYGGLDLDLELEANTALVLGGTAPVSWLSLQLDPDIAMIRIHGNLWRTGDGGLFSDEVQRRLTAHDGPLATVLVEDEMDQVVQQLRSVDLYLDRLNCQVLQKEPFPSLASRYWLCPVTRFHLGVTRPEES